MGPEPVAFDQRFASAFHLAKQHVVEQNPDPGRPDTLRQFGSAYLDQDLVLPPLPAALRTRSPSVELFVCHGDGTCEPTGEDHALIDWWRPSVTALVTAVRLAVADAGIKPASEMYLTGSVTPAEDVANEAHLDDDQFNPGDGVGLVAIVGSGAGPRVATEAVPTITSPRAGLPVSISQETFDRFTVGTVADQRASANRIVVFPQFGQLHAGPSPDQVRRSDDGHRRLLVLRAATTPVDVPTGRWPAAISDRKRRS